MNSKNKDKIFLKYQIVQNFKKIKFLDKQQKLLKIVKKKSMRIDKNYKKKSKIFNSSK